MTTPNLPTAPPVEHEVLGFPAPPYTPEEMNLLHAAGYNTGGAAVNALRALHPQVFHVTTPAPPAQVVYVNGATVAEDPSRDTLLAFLVALTVFGLGWLGGLYWGHEAGWRCALWGAIAGAGAGLLCLATVGGNRRAHP